MVVAVVLFVFVTIGLSTHEELPEEGDANQCSAHEQIYYTFCEV